MSRLKLFRVLLLAVFLVVGIWYFFIKDYNYKVTFSISQSPGIIYNSLIQWNNGEIPNNKVVTTLNQTPFNEVNQNLFLGDSVLKINWSLKKKNDSTTIVTAKFKDEKNSFKQNLQVPFYNNVFVNQSISAVKNFSKTLIQNKKNYKLSGVTHAKIPPQNYAYITLQSSLNDKASVMVRNIPTIMNYIKDNNIQLAGNPFVEITNWNVEKDSIKFNFCFPIEKRESYPETYQVLFKQTKEKEALKVVFNGNYKISHMAWYQIIDYAKTNNINTDNLPVEFFLNDPHAGGNDLEWLAEIYVGIID
ncbi:effector-binding domain-containing protein [Flaviramulus basaltis]|uniref:Effector-binding domain-containing protein n=1 Tax=Flaviramulus basaltis TaxID=369401 RepID=A0A1K2IKC7_9FLAO|nr:GyrI-like domain-containing protein [Flaviramulus basaltis]SFZ92758.1 effector-binding domain-containing protein [Flaviramulus basaltis]